MEDLFFEKTLVAGAFAIVCYFFYKTVFSGIAALSDSTQVVSHKKYRNRLALFLFIAILITECIVHPHRKNSSLFLWHLFGCDLPFCFLIALQFTITRENRFPIWHYAIGLLASFWFLAVLVTGGILLYEMQ